MSAHRPRPGEGSTVDLASRALGAGVMAASDETFGEKENLIVAGAPAVAPGRYGHKGEIVDGWETRRQRGPDSATAHDWVLVRLAAPGTVDEVVVDTTGFTGNQPPFVRVEGLDAGRAQRPAADLVRDEGWFELVPRSPAAPDRPNAYSIAPGGGAVRVTHVRLTIFPDGGVARLRVHGRIVADLSPWDGLTVNLLAGELGAHVVEQSDGFYSAAANLLLPGPARSMAEGWEARRLRDPDPDRHDHVVFALAAAGVPQVLEVDTGWFVANASEAVRLWGHPGPVVPAAGDPGWQLLLDRSDLVPDAPHRWRLTPSGPIRFTTLEAYPDAGLSRVRLHGRLAAGGRTVVRRTGSVVVVRGDAEPDELPA